MLEVFVFATVYLGMLAGGIPGLAIDRTGVALVGAIVLIAGESLSPAQSWQSIDLPTMGLLFGLMVVSAQFRLGGFYTVVTRRLATRSASPQILLGTLIAAVAVLSALLSNDIICLAMTPILIEACSRRNLNPIPFLLGLACAANIGSAATLIGNPQNMLIGQRLELSFAGYAADAFLPSVFGLLITWGVICWQFKGNWHTSQRPITASAPDFNGWQSCKGLVILAALIVAFLIAPIPREIAAMAAAGILLMSRRMGTRPMLALVDWHLLVLFGGLFVVNEAFESAGMLDRVFAVAKDLRLDLENPATLFGATAVLSNIVSNVPATMLLLPAATHPISGLTMALSSTLAGNFIIVSSIANIIVVEQAGILGVRLTWTQHARTGIPVTLLSLGAAVAWIWFRAQ